MIGRDRFGTFDVDELVAIGARLQTARYPATALLELIPFRQVPPSRVGNLLGASGTTMSQVLSGGLTDRQADLWATRFGYHPAEVWPDWVDGDTLAS